MKEYVYDGSFDGLLTAIFYAYPEKVETLITHEKHFIPSLLTEAIPIQIEADKVQRVLTSIETKLSSRILSTLYYVYLSETPECESVILAYLKLLYKHGVSINLAKNNDTIIKIDTLYRKVSHEAHRFTGFVRFKEIAPLCFYSKIAPDHCILPLLSSHFKTRFSDQSFIIHDETRQMALVYNKKEIFLQELTPEENLFLLQNTPTDDFEELFQAFYKSTTIEERLNPRLQKRMMPTRYWENLIEV